MDYQRKGSIIAELESGNATTYFVPGIEKKVPSVNAAKRESRKLQAAGNTVRVVR